MSERELSIEHDPSTKLAADFAEMVAALTGAREWSGDESFEVQMIDEKEQVGYRYQISKTEDWIAVQEKISDNPGLVRTFLLEKKDGRWVYNDPYLTKYGESSLDKLQSVFDKLKIAIVDAHLDEPESE